MLVVTGVLSCSVSMDPLSAESSSQSLGKLPKDNIPNAPGVRVFVGSKAGGHGVISRPKVTVTAVYVWRSVRAGGDTKTQESRRTLEVPDEVARAPRQHTKQAAKRLRAGRWVVGAH